MNNNTFQKWCESEWIPKNYIIVRNFDVAES